MNCQDVKKTPFSLEAERDSLAKKKKYDGFLLTYSNKNGEIEDRNSGQLWDLLNEKSSFDKKENPMAFYRIKRVEKMISNDSKILDIGFGSAILEQRLNKTKKRIDLYGIDISKLSVEKAKIRFKNFEFKIGNVLKIPYQDNCFDYVLALEVLEHIKPSNIFKALKEIRRVLKDKGYFIVSVPLNEGLFQLIKEGKNPNAHLREYTYNIIKAELEIMKFNILKKYLLYAFHKNYYIKSFFVKFLFPTYKKPNNIVIFSQKE